MAVVVHLAAVVLSAVAHHEKVYVEQHVID